MWKFVCLAARHGGDVRPAALLPMAAQTGGSVLRAGLGWAWLVEGEGDRGTLRGFGSALIRVIITAGTRIHTHTHTLAVVFATGVCPDSCGFPGAEVITCSAILHGGLRYHSGCRINCLSSLCEQFLSPRAPEEATGKERDKKAEKMRVNMHG